MPVTPRGTQMQDILPEPSQHVPRLPILTQFLVSRVLGYPTCVPGKEMHPGARGYREHRVSLGAEMTHVYRESLPFFLIRIIGTLERFILLHSGISFPVEGRGESH